MPIFKFPDSLPKAIRSKKHYLMKWPVLILLCTLPVFSFAAIRTVSNNPANIAQYTSIQSAINDSANGDTVLVHGSPIAYSGFNITNKRIIMIGPGFSPDVQTPLAALVYGNISFSGADCKKTEIHGMYFIGDIHNIYFSTSMDSIFFYRNVLEDVFMAASITLRGFTFKGNYFVGTIGSHPFTIHQNFLFENNIFEIPGVVLSSFSNSSNNNIWFNHNLFFSGSGSPVNAFDDVKNINFINNIFVERNYDASFTLNHFTSNITFNCSPNDPWNVNGNTDAGGNVAGMDPQMTDQAAVNNGTAGLISNYTISSGPANNAGSDGKDMGLLYDPTGGMNWIYGRNARLPSVVELTITNPVLVAGESLNINLQARKNE
jgi:hypothetical protein